MSNIEKALAAAVAVLAVLYLSLLEKVDRITPLPASSTDSTINEIKAKLDYVDYMLWGKDNQFSLSKRVNLLESRNQYSAHFTPSSQGYAAIETDQGKLFITLADIQPYADGYKLHLRIGNPTSTTISRPKLTVSYNKDYNKEDNFLNWAENEKRIEATAEKDLLAGYWNNISVVLRPATKEEVANIWVKLETDVISLKTDHRK